MHYLIVHDHEFVDNKYRCQAYLRQIDQEASNVGYCAKSKTPRQFQGIPTKIIVGYTSQGLPFQLVIGIHHSKNVVVRDIFNRVNNHLSQLVNRYASSENKELLLSTFKRDVFKNYQDQVYTSLTVIYKKNEKLYCTGVAESNVWFSLRTIDPSSGKKQKKLFLQNINKKHISAGDELEGFTNLDIKSLNGERQELKEVGKTQKQSLVKARIKVPDNDMRQRLQWLMDDANLYDYLSGWIEPYEKNAERAQLCQLHWTVHDVYIQHKIRDILTESDRIKQTDPSVTPELAKALLWTYRAVQNPTDENIQQCQSLANQLYGRPRKRYKLLGSLMLGLSLALITLSVLVLVGTLSLAWPVGAGLAAGGVGCFATGIGFFACSRRRGLSKQMHHLTKALPDYRKDFNRVPSQVKTSRQSGQAYVRDAHVEKAHNEVASRLSQNGGLFLNILNGETGTPPDPNSSILIKNSQG